MKLLSVSCLRMRLNSHLIQKLVHEGKQNNHRLGASKGLVKICLQNLLMKMNYININFIYGGLE